MRQPDAEARKRAWVTRKEKEKPMADEPSTPCELAAADCAAYVEDGTVCDDMGEPKGQCANCGGKWYDHRIDVLPEDERASVLALRQMVATNPTARGRGER
jgi:hypothetical protein